MGSSQKLIIITVDHLILPTPSNANHLDLEAQEQHKLERDLQDRPRRGLPMPQAETASVPLDYSYALIPTWTPNNKMRPLNPVSVTLNHIHRHHCSM